MEENQTLQPDYNFIVNQTPPEPNGKGAPKKRNIKLIVLIVLVVLTALAVVAALLFPNKNDTTNNSSSGAVTVQENAVKSAQEQAVRQYLNDLNDNNYEAAYSLLAANVTLGEETAIPKDWFIQTIAPAFTKEYQTRPCTVLTPDESQPNTVESYCLSSDKQEVTVHTYEITEDNGIKIISSMKITDIWAQQ